MTALLKRQSDRGSLTSIAAYDQAAESLANLYESTSFETVHADVLDLLPAVGSTILDVGAGSGRDAAALAQRGYRVCAVEPSAGLLAQAQIRHPTPQIEWVKDALPALEKLGPRRFALIFVSAVWMHLAPRDRALAMRRLSQLMDHAAHLVISLRTGPDDQQRGIRCVDPASVIAHAVTCGLDVERQSTSPDSLGRAEIEWVTLAFIKR
ncbi:class I SAM-dependent methyltransferase [Xanthobacter agilis]|uniref:class I SAM-dependent methyltransferase n=1 Tax=Xanthobacter agilis TaxID=47492 RepID=UPI00372B0763